MPLDARTVVLFDDGYWRYADDHVDNCWDIAFVGKFCATPNEWTIVPRHPAKVRQTRPEFTDNNNTLAQATSLTETRENRTLPDEAIGRHLTRRITGDDGLRMSLMSQRAVQIDGRNWDRLAFGTDHVKLFSVTRISPQRVVIVETSQFGTGLLWDEHTEKHNGFLKNLELDGDG